MGEFVSLVISRVAVRSWKLIFVNALVRELFCRNVIKSIARCVCGVSEGMTF